MRNSTTDEHGHTYGRLSVLSYAGVNRHQKVMWLCECSCGTKKTICGGSLRNGLTISCGCYRRETTSLTDRSRSTGIRAERRARKHVRKNAQHHS